MTRTMEVGVEFYRGAQSGEGAKWGMAGGAKPGGEDRNTEIIYKIIDIIYIT